MSAVALRGLLTRKLRTALTMIAIVLGVSMISGTFVLTDTINQSFSKIFQQANQTTDAVVQRDQPVSSFGQPPPLPASLLTIVQGTSGVAAAEGTISARAQLYDSHGNSLGATSGAPALLASWSTPRFRQLKLVSGHAPQGDQIVVDKDTASRHHLRIGERVGVIAVGPLKQFTIVGIVKFGTVGSIGGASIVAMDVATAQSITNKQGRYDQIRAAAVSGITAQDLVGRIRAAIPPALRGSVKVQTGAQNASDQTAAIGDALGALTDILLAFGFIAVFVGAFVIFNTFSITVAQRTREFGMLRTVGATRGQVLRSVILEALLVGVIAALLGLLAGFGIAKGLNALFLGFGIDLPNTGLVFAARTVIVGLLVGIVVTLVASLVPAIRATNVPPIAALREGAQLPRGRFSRFVPYIAVGLIVLGILMLAVGVFGSFSQTAPRLTLIGLGALVLFLGTAMITPQIVRPLALVIGWPMQRFTAITGRLARENAERNPSRTAVTAAALMIGLALVGFVTVFAAELKKTADDAINREIVGTFAIYSDNNSLIPAGIADAVKNVPGIAAVSTIKVDAAKLQGIGTVQTNGVQPSSFGRLYHFQWKNGSESTLLTMGPNDALIDENMAKNNHLSVGSRLYATTPADTHHTFTVAGIYKTSQYLPDWVIRYDTMATAWQQPQDFAVLLNVAPGENLAVVKAKVSAIVKASYPTATVHSQQDIKNQNDKGVNQLLALIYVLLAMSVLVSLFGIINTLILSVYERTREIGMLRAIGTTRAQVRWIVRWESVITAVIGAITGLILGLVLSVIVTAGLQSQGIEYAFPIGQLLLWVLFAILFGIVAAAYPARRAARLDVLQAIAYE